MLQKKLHDFKRLVFILGEPEERGGLPGDLGQARIGGDNLAEAFEVADGCEVPDVTAVRAQQIDHAPAQPPRQR